MSQHTPDAYIERNLWDAEGPDWELLPTEGECSRCQKIRDLDDLGYDLICLACQAILDIEFLAGHQLEGFRVKP